MKAYTHIAVGAAAYAGLEAAFSEGPSPGVAVAAAGALAPDLDEPGSFAGRFVPLAAAVLAGAGYFLGSWSYLFLSGLLLLMRFLPHRGLTHSLVGALVFTFPVYFLSYWIPFLVGYLLHIAGDILTAGGVRLWWPKDKSCSLTELKVGGWWEKGVFALFLSLLFWIVI